MANVPIAGVSYHHDGLPKPMSVHCLGQSFNKAPIQRFGARGMTNIGQANMPQQSIRYIGIQPCMQHIHSNSPYMISNNIPRKYINGMVNQQNVWRGVTEGASPNLGNMGNNFSYGNVPNNCLPGNMHRNISPGNMSCPYRPANFSNNGNNPNIYANGGSSTLHNLPQDMVQQNVGFDMNGNLLVNHNRNSIVTFNNGHLKINDGQLTFNDGQIIFNGAHVRMNSPGNSEQYKVGHPNMDYQFNPNTSNGDVQNRSIIRPDGQHRITQLNNVVQFQVNTKIEGQFKSNMPHHMGQFNVNNSRYKLTHLPLQKVKNQIIQNNTSITENDTLKSDIDQKTMSPIPLNIPNNLGEQQTVLQGNENNIEKNTLLNRRDLHELPANFEDGKRDVIAFSPTYDPQRSVEFSHKQENELFRAGSRASCSPIRPRGALEKPWMDQSDLSDTLKKVRPSWFKSELISPKRQQMTDSDYPTDSCKKMKVENMVSHNLGDSPEDQNPYNPNRYNGFSDNRTMYDTKSKMNNRDVLCNDNMAKMYRKESIEMNQEHLKFCEDQSDQNPAKTVETVYLDDNSDLKKRSVGNAEFPIKIKEEDGIVRDFNQQLSYKNDNVSPLSHNKTNFYDSYGTNSNESGDVSYSGQNVMKHPLDTPKISRTFFSDTQKVENNIDFLDEPPPLIKVEMF